MPAASACAVSSPAVASGTCRPPPTTCASYTGSLSAAPDQPPRGTPKAIGPSSGPPEARQGRLSALLDRFKRQRPAIQQQPLGSDKLLLDAPQMPAPHPTDINERLEGLKNYAQAAHQELEQA